MAVVKNYMDIYSKILKAILEDDTMDCLFNVIWTGPFKSFAEEYLKLYKKIKGKYQRTIATWIYGPSVPLVQEMSSRMEDLGFPVFPDVETSMKALGIAYQYAIRKKGGA